MAGELLLEGDAEALAGALANANGEDSGGSQQEAEPDQSGRTAESDATSQPEEATEAGAPEELTPELLAEKAGITTQELYKRLNLNLDGDKVTLEQYKDRARELKNVDFKAAELDRQQAEFQVAKQQQTEQLRAWVEAIQNGTATPEHVQQIQAQSDGLKELAATRTRELIPEWRDGEVQSAEKAAIGTMLQRFGKPQGTETLIHDPGDWLMLRYFHQLESRLSGALEQMKEPKHRSKAAPKTPAPKSTPAGLGSEAAALLDGLRHGNN